MNALDERARRAAASVHRLADTVDPEEVLGRIEGRSTRARWFAPAVALGAAAAVAVAVVAVGNLLSDDTLRIDDPGIVQQPDGEWPPAGYEVEDGWIHLDPEAHGIDDLPSDVVVFEGDFLLLGTSGRLWRSSDGLAWENRAGLNLSNGDLAVDRGRVVAMSTIENGRELRILWSEDGDNWTTVENRGQLTVSVAEQEWFDPHLVAGPRGFVIASNVWREQEETSGPTQPSNQGATVRILESPDGQDWGTTQEWGNQGVAHIIGLAGDTNGATLVFQGDGGTRAYRSGDEEWIEVADHPGGHPTRLARSAPVPFVGDGPEGQDLATTSQASHTWEFSVMDGRQGQEVWLRTAGGWQEATFEGPSVGAVAGWSVAAIIDAPDALYAHVTSAFEDEALGAVFRSEDGVLWTELPRDPVFTDAVLTGNDVVTATDGRTSIFALACCEPGRFDGDTKLSLFVRRAPDTTSPDPSRPDVTPTAWERIPDADFDQQPSSMLLHAESLGGRLVAFAEHLEPIGDGGLRSAGSDVWLSDDGTEWRRTSPDALTGEVDLVDTAAADSRVYALLRTADGAQVWTSRDGERWDQLPGFGDELGDTFQASALAVLSDGPVAVIGVRVVASDGASFTDAEPVAAVRTGDGWRIESMDEVGRNRFPTSATWVDGDLIVVGGQESAEAAEVSGVVWRRSPEGTWTVTDVGTSQLAHVTPTEGGWLAVSSGPGATTVVRGDGDATGVEVLELDGVVLFDLTTVEGAAVGAGNTIVSGPDDRPAVVRFGPATGAETTTIGDPGGIARGIALDGERLYVVGEATDRAQDGQGFVVRAAVWRGPVPGAPDAGVGRSPELATCDASELSGEPAPQAGLPEAVQTMRVEIASAAARCDYELLAELAMTSSSFTASFGGGEPNAGWWRDSDLRTLRLLLDLPYASQTDGEGTTYYAWPSAFLESTDEAWAALYDAGLATPEDRASMEEMFGAWVGFRHGITADGQWIFYVAGD